MENQNKPWRNTTLFQYLKEISHEGYQQMLEYEAAGGELDMLDLSAKKYYEKHNKKRLKQEETTTEVEDGTTIEPEEYNED